MFSNKAGEIIKTFSQEEVKSFGAFLKSPYFNSNKNVIRLYDVMRKHANASEKVSEEFIYGKIFKGKEYNYGIFKNLLSELYKLAEEFLTVNANKHNKDSISNILTLLGEYEKRKLDNNFLTRYGKAEQGFSSRKMDPEFDENYARLLEAKRNFFINRSDVKNESDTLIVKSQYIFGAIVSFLYQEALPFHAAEHSLNKSPEVNLLRELLNHLDIDAFLAYLKNLNDSSLSHYIIRLQSISLFLQPRNDSLYFELKKNILADKDKFSNYELYSLLNTTLMNYCETRSSQGEPAFQNERYEILKEIFSHVKFNSDGVGAVFLPIYIDFVNLALKKGDTDAAVKFASDFRKELDSSIRETGYNLALAYVSYAHKQYEESLKYLSKTGHIDFHFKLRIKFLYLKIYYNLSLIEEGLSLLDSFKHFVKDTVEIHPQFRKILNDSIKYHILLFKFKANPEHYSAKDYDDFVFGVKKSRILQKQWYLDEAESLRKG